MEMAGVPYISSLVSMRLLAAEVLTSHLPQPYKEPELFAGNPLDRPLRSSG